MFGGRARFTKCSKMGFRQHERHRATETARPGLSAAPLDAIIIARELLSRIYKMFFAVRADNPFGSKYNQLRLWNRDLE